jgi:hypothetical protein
MPPYVAQHLTAPEPLLADLFHSAHAFHTSQSFRSCALEFAETIQNLLAGHAAQSDL